MPPKVYLKTTAKTPPPVEDRAYFIGKNGIFFKKNDIVTESLLPIKTVRVLAEVEPYVNYLLPPIPVELLERILAFFRRIARKMGSEAAVILVYNPATRVFDVEVPPQIITPVSVHYTPPLAASTEGFKLVGSIHSHVYMDAYHSTTDHDDEIGFDGVHITIGNLDEPGFGMAVSIMISGTRFEMKPNRVCEGIRQYGFKAPSQLQLELTFPDTDKEQKRRAARARTATSTPTLPKEKRDEVRYYLEDIPKGSGGTFPEEWLANIQKVQPKQRALSVSTHRSSYTDDDDDPHLIRWEHIDKDLFF